jgi:putative aldouronate transport system permease protein
MAQLPVTPLSPVAPPVARTGGRGRRRNLARTWPLYAMMMPALIALFLFSYLPMYGVVISFQDYKPLRGIFDSPWVGLKHYRNLFSLPEFPLLLRNTLVISLGKIIFTQMLALIFAIALNEVTNRFFKRSVQTIVYLPHFLSWIILGGLFLDIFALNGIVNRAVQALGFQPISFLGQPQFFQPLLIGTHSWKEFGWSAIIYLAALTNVDPQLHEAAAIDGAGRWKRILHITLPGILPVVLLVGALALGSILNAGFEQVLVLQNPAVRSTGEIIETYVYRKGLEQAQYSLATAVGLFNSVLGLILILLSRWLADRWAGYRIF